jgi:hypothetical protein
MSSTQRALARDIFVRVAAREIHDPRLPEWAEVTEMCIRAAREFVEATEGIEALGVNAYAENN